MKGILQGIVQWFRDLFSPNSDVSSVRVESMAMFIVATYFLFTRVNMDTLTWEGFMLVTFLYGMAFFPKVIQKRFERGQFLKR